MAKNKKNKKENSGDALFGRLGRGSAKKGGAAEEEELFAFETKEAEAEEYDSIDITEDADPSDSELDINELLRKYMPEYSDGESSSGGSGTGVLSRLKQTRADAEAMPANEADDELISVLDSVFSQSFEEQAEEPAVTEEADELLVEEIAEEPAEELPEELPEKPRKNTSSGKGGLFGRKNKRKEKGLRFCAVPWYWIRPAGPPRSGEGPPPWARGRWWEGRPASHRWSSASGCRCSCRGGS